MPKEKLQYHKDVAFINREKELSFLKKYINERPESVLFVHGPKSSGKTTLLYRFLEEIGKEQRLDIKYLNLRKILVSNYKDFIRVFFGIDYSRSKEDVKEKREYSLFNFFKLSVEVLKGIESGELDPFEVMEKEFIKLNKRGIKPILIIDELQILDHIYMNSGRDRQLIIELFNFFVAMTKESHLAHIIIASSDGYFIDTVYNDSRLKKTSKFYRVDYLEKDEVIKWLSNIEKYSKITEYTLNEEEGETIWQVVGGSAWEIQDILSELFNAPLEKVLAEYAKKIQGMIAHYCEFDDQKREILRVIDKKNRARAKDFENIGIESSKLKEILRDMVRNNILFFDPTDATYNPQGSSYRHGIRLYLEEYTF